MGFFDKVLDFIEDVDWEDVADTISDVADTIRDVIDDVTDLDD